MTYSITRNYDTDLSRTEVRAILANMARRIAEAKGSELPTKSVFGTPEIIDASEDYFEVPVLATVTAAGWEPDELTASEVVYDGRYFVETRGSVINNPDGPENVRVVVRKARRGDARWNGNTYTFEDYLEIIGKIAAENDEDDEDEDEPEIRTDGGVDADDQSLDAELYDDAKPKTQQAIESAEADDADEIREALPSDIRRSLTKRAFSPGSMRKLLIDTYYGGPIGIGRGGWIGIYGGGAPGTEMRRPDGALYNFPRSWRYAALERGLNTGIITHVGSGKFTATERGVELLGIIDRCAECGDQKVPMIRTSGYQASPRSTPIISRKLVTACPECGATGYGGRGTNSSSSYKELDRSDRMIEYASEMIENVPEARVYGVERDVDVDVHEVPEVDEDATTELLDDVVEDHTPGTPAEVFAAYDKDQHDRQVITIGTSGENYRFAGFDQAIAVSRANKTAEIHFDLADDGEDLVAEMSYDVAMDGAKEVLKVFVGSTKKYAWDNANKQWHIDPDVLPLVIGNLTREYNNADHGYDQPAWEVTVSPDAMAAVDVPMLGVDADGDLI